MSFRDSRFWLNLMLVMAFVFLLGSLLYTHRLANSLSLKERQAMVQKARAIEITGNETPSVEPSPFEEATQTFLFDMVKEETSRIPWILTDAEMNYLDGRNTGLNESLSFDALRKAAAPLIERFRVENEPVRIAPQGPRGLVLYVVYGDSPQLKQLRWFPLWQGVVAIVFVAVVVLGFLAAKRSEENKVWVGLAKETAHQLGTPVSSLMAWIELLRGAVETDPEAASYVEEMARDVLRLEGITERFSKIGAQPELSPVDIHELLERSSLYLSSRMTRSGRVKIRVENRLPAGSTLSVNPQLFDWVIENLLKNALDALLGKAGEIVLSAERQGKDFVIDVRDNGKGMSKSLQRKVFQPGFTTKKRGWGLGLSLSRRIIENYHRGRIFVKESAPGQGSTFRIVMPGLDVSPSRMAT